MEGEYTSTIIRVILAMDYASIQLKYSRKISHFSNNPPQWMKIQEIDTLWNWLYSERYFRKETALG